MGNAQSSNAPGTLGAAWTIAAGPAGGAAEEEHEHPRRIVVSLPSMDGLEDGGALELLVSKRCRAEPLHRALGDSSHWHNISMLNSAAQGLLTLAISCLTVGKLIEEIRFIRSLRGELGSIAAAFTGEGDGGAGSAGHGAPSARPGDSFASSSQPTWLPAGAASDLAAGLALLSTGVAAGAGDKGPGAGAAPSGWATVSGLPDVKMVLQEATVLPTLRPDLFKGIRQPPRGILLFGPPGSGKTLLARAVAAESRASFFAVTGSSVLSMWYGQSEANVRALFEQARKQQPAVIFIDEVDSLLSRRGGGGGGGTASDGAGGSGPDKRVTNEFLAFIDGIQTEKGDTRITVMAATNAPWDLDEAALSRFARRVYVPLPDRTARAALMAQAMDGVLCDISNTQYLELADRAAKYSGRDLVAVCREAAMRPLRELWGAGLLANSTSGAVGAEVGVALAQQRLVGLLTEHLRRGRKPRKLRKELGEWRRRQKGAADWCDVDVALAAAAQAVGGGAPAAAAAAHGQDGVPLVGRPSAGSSGRSSREGSRPTGTSGAGADAAPVVPVAEVPERRRFWSRGRGPASVGAKAAVAASKACAAAAAAANGGVAAAAAATVVGAASGSGAGQQQGLQAANVVRRRSSTSGGLSASTTSNSAGSGAGCSACGHADISSGSHGNGSGPCSTGAPLPPLPPSASCLSTVGGPPSCAQGLAVASAAGSHHHSGGGAPSRGSAVLRNLLPAALSAAAGGSSHTTSCTDADNDLNEEDGCTNGAAVCEPSHVSSSTRQGAVVAAAGLVPAKMRVQSSDTTPAGAAHIAPGSASSSKATAAPGTWAGSSALAASGLKADAGAAAAASSKPPLGVSELLTMPADRLRAVGVHDFEAALKLIMPTELELSTRYEEFNSRYGSGADTKRANASHASYMHIYL